MSAQEPAKIERLDKVMDHLIDPGAKLEKVAGGFTWTEGPIWIKRGGYLLFADIPANSIWKYVPGQKPILFLHPSGWAETTPFGGKEPGSNGMTVDAKGRLTVAGHANRNVWRLETMNPHGPKTTLASRFEGKRFNSPNDLAYRSDGSLYFTDPPYGLPTQQDDDPHKDMKINGVYRIASGKVQLLISNMSRPNGIAFSPDEKYLYVDSSDLKYKVWMRYEVQPDGSVTNGKVLLNCTSDPREGGPDGMKVDREGNIFGAGPGGVWILSPDGKHIGTIDMPERTGNLAWGGEDGRTLYITASSGLYRIPVKVGGLVP